MPGAGQGGGIGEPDMGPAGSKIRLVRWMPPAGLHFCERILANVLK